MAWVTYEPSSHAWKDFRTGLGLRYSGDRWDGSDSLKAGAYTLVDAMIGYDFDNVRVQLNVNNLADKYFVASTRGGRAFLGAARSVNLTAKYRF